MTILNKTQVLNLLEQYRIYKSAVITREQTQENYDLPNYCELLRRAEEKENTAWNLLYSLCKKLDKTIDKPNGTIFYLCSSAERLNVTELQLLKVLQLLDLTDFGEV